MSDAETSAGTSTPVEGAGAETPLLVLTDIAREKIRKAQEDERRPEAALRVRVHEEGAAFKYNLEFVDGAPSGGGEGESEGAGSPAEGPPGQAAGADEVVVDDDIVIYVDPESAAKLRGSTLDYVDELSGSWFKFDNPNKPALAEHPLAERVQKVLEDKVNPGVASHGGWIALVGIEETRVFLKFGGGCQGCGMIDVTLKQGVEVMIREEVPEVTEILDTTDHAGGTNPYYQPGK